MKRPGRRIDHAEHKRIEEKRKLEASSKKKRNNENGETETVSQLRIQDNSDGANDERKKIKVLRNKKRKSEKLAEAEVTEMETVDSGQDGGFDAKNSAGKKDKKKSKLTKKKTNKEKTKETDVAKCAQQSNEDGLDSNKQSDNSDGANDVKKKNKVLRNKKRKSEKLAEAEITEMEMVDSGQDVGFDAKSSSGKKDKKKSKLKKKKRNKEKTKENDVAKCVQQSNNDGDDLNQQSGKSKRMHKTEMKGCLRQKDASLQEDRGEAEEDDVYQISSGDEDCSRGMKKWISEYHMARPGVKILQKRIDDFIVNHEAQEEKARQEREAQAAEGGWTVVVHHKGRKKTTDTESGITVGSVAQAAVMDKMTKKKNKEVGIDFYRFQKREAQRNEIMMLQSKFEQDKKRIQQMRAARKFRPY